VRSNLCCRVLQVALRIATAIHGVHLVGVVHGDVKPRNIVRSGSNDFRLIDLDMSFAVQIMATTANSPSDHASGQVPSARTFDLAPKGKIRASSAYCCPELIRYVASESERARETTEAALGSPFRIDVWSFGATLYEIATGLALFENQYDRLTPMGEALLVNWTGLTDSHVATIVQLYGASESASLIDALKWLLDPIASHRPADMADVLAHVFFNPKVSSLCFPSMLFLYCARCPFYTENRWC
jgi:serine/threonine protein kinase